VRPVAQCEKIVNEASKLGFKNIIIPERNKKKIINKNINIIGAESLKDVLSKIF
jgi:DNA repair protein RadA/Sms